jgi:hypothetical protein
MYTQIFKEILLEMKHDEKSIKDFIVYCRTGDYGSPTTITKLENEYSSKLAIWWYTYPSFIYDLLNGALRTLEADTIINMGFLFVIVTIKSNNYIKTRYAVMEKGPL